MEDENDVVADYESSLSELTYNSKPHINMLTMLAEEYVKFAPRIVQTIEEHLHKVATNQMLPTLYLIDSIVKNLPNSSYKDLFKKNLVKTFVTVFEKGDEKTRASLHKLRDTWAGYFPPSKLYAIDMKVHGIDKAWPIQQPDRSNSNATNASTSSTAIPAGGKAPSTVYLNPEFFKGTKSKPGDNRGSSNGSTSNNQILLQQLEQKKKELEARQRQEANRPRTNASSSSHHHPVQLQSVVTIPSPSQRDPRLARGTASDQHRSSSTSSASHRSDRGSSSRGGTSDTKDGRQQQYQDVDLRNRNNVPSLPPKKRKPQSPLVDSESEASAAKDKRRRSDVEVKQESPNPFGTSEDQDLRTLYRLQPPVTKIKEEVVDDSSMSAESIVQPAPISASIREKTPTRPISPAVHQILAAAQATVTATTIAAALNALTSITTTAPTANVRISIDAPELPDRSLGTLVAHRDTILQRAEQQLNEGQITRQQYNDIICEMNSAVDQAQFGRPPKSSSMSGGFGRPPQLNESSFSAGTSGQARPSTASGPKAPSARENSSFDPIPANNRIFVDGRAYEVRYIEDVAVIERNGLPHRIYFVGQPRDVVVDGFAHTLAFGESKTVLIDGQDHVIRFGAPSRELYMGRFAFRGSFGGPPILATIGGVQHKIQLCGPPPEVKIDPEPAHELLRYVKESHMPRPGPSYDFANGPSQQRPTRRPVLVPSGPPPTMGPQPSSYQQPPQGYPPMGPAPFDQSRPFLPIQPQQSGPRPGDMLDLYASLVNAGIISAGKQQEQRQTAPSTIPKKRAGVEEVVERKSSEPDLTEFSPGVMKVRYASVVEALYRQKTQCGTCGMRFADGDRQKYSKHLDWHFQQSRRDKEKANVRPWFLAADDWIRYEEAVEDGATKLKSTVFESAQKEQQPQQQDESGRILVASTDSVINAMDDNQECAVCGEKFEQFYDDDEEVWKMRNATLIRGKAYHPLCYQDVQSTDTEHEAAPIFVPLPEDLMASNSSCEDTKQE